MKITFTGIVKSRVARKNNAGEMRYYLEIEEPGQYPSRFQVLAKDAALVGPSDGFAKVGASVIITGYLNGVAEDVDSKKEPGKKFRTYRTWISLATIAPAGSVSGPVEAPVEDLEEMPF